MRCLIDGDILRYEIGHSGQYKDEDGEEKVREWDFVEELIDHKIATICDACESDEDPCLYLTSDSTTIRVYNRWRKTHQPALPPVKFIPNYRHDIATVKPYKGTRKSEKPAHYANITAHMMENYIFQMSNGVEADDQMAIDQDENTIICSRDKDLRQVPGNHYSWECGKQLEIGPLVFDKKGYIEDKGNGKVFGGGELFFLYQLLVGDAVDNIPGLPKCGHVGAMKLLSEGQSRKECYNLILSAYEKIYGDTAVERLTEQAQLLYLLRRSDDEWVYPY